MNFDASSSVASVAVRLFASNGSVHPEGAIAFLLPSARDLLRVENRVEQEWSGPCEAAWRWAEHFEDIDRRRGEPSFGSDTHLHTWDIRIRKSDLFWVNPYNIVPFQAHHTTIEKPFRDLEYPDSVPDKGESSRVSL